MVTSKMLINNLPSVHGYINPIAYIRVESKTLFFHPQDFDYLNSFKIFHIETSMKLINQHILSYFRAIPTPQPPQPHPSPVPSRPQRHRRAIAALLGVAPGHGAAGDVDPCEGAGGRLQLVDVGDVQPWRKRDINGS